MKWRSKPLAFRLMVKLIIGLTLIFSATAVVQITLQQQFAEHCARINGLALAEVIYGSLHSTMLANDRDQLQTSVSTIAKQAPNLTVRIFNKEGKVAIASNTEDLGKTFSKNDPACKRCHLSPKKKGLTLHTLKPSERTHRFMRGSELALGIIRPIENQKTCVQSGCHGSVEEEPFLGVLDLSLTLAHAQRSRKQIAIFSVVAAFIGVVLVAIIIVWVVRRAVQRPIRHLISSLGLLGEGDYSVRYSGTKSSNSNEFDKLGNALNQMAQDLQYANEELVEWNHTLERRVEEKTAELRLAQDQMVRVERMASLGKLSAVVAHEINNPLASVVTYSKLLIRRMQKLGKESPLKDDSLEILNAIASESARCGDIVTNLLLFARRTGSKQEPTDVNEIIGKSLFLLKHKMDLAQVKEVRTLEENLPTIICDPGQLEQALLALCVNAIEAMPEGGNLEVHSFKDTTTLCIQISDQGIGMPEDVRKHIFEPFFTTKSEEEGKGLGLGLSVVYGIVQRNRGTINVESEIGKGTIFTLEFPLAPPEDEQQSIIEKE